MADQRVGGVEDVAEAAVVLLQFDLVLHIELAHKVRHIAHARAAKGVNALVVIAHGNHGAAGRVGRGIGALPGQHLEPGVLQAVGVLKLVNQNVAEAPLVMLAHGVVVAQQFVAAQHELTKIDHAFALALLFVKLVDLDLFNYLGVAWLDVGGTLAVFLTS